MRVRVAMKGDRGCGYAGDAHVCLFDALFLSATVVRRHPRVTCEGGDGACGCLRGANDGGREEANELGDAASVGDDVAVLGHACHLPAK